MKLLYTATAYPPSIGGAQTHQHLLAQAMMRSNHIVQVVSHWDMPRTDWLLGTTLKAPKNVRKYVIDGVPVCRLGLSWTDKLALLPYVPMYYPAMGIALPKISSLLQKYILPYAAEAALVHNVRIGRAGLSDASMAAARRYDIPFVLTPVHHPRWVGWRYQAYLNIYRQADGIMALTHNEKKTLCRLGADARRVHVIGHGPVLSSTSDAESFRHKYKVSNPFVLFLGQHYAYKGYQKLLKAAKHVWQRFPDVHFVFVGPSIKNSDKVFEEFKDPRIHKLGSVDLQDKTNALSACSLLCVPSDQESFGGVYTEAWSLGKPVIGCRIPAIEEVIDDGVNGFLVNQNVDEIASRISDLLLSPTSAEEMGTAGKRKVQDNYTWDKISSRLETAYKSILGNDA